jgi:hypothetical protein
VLISQRKRNRERLFWLERRQELYNSYAIEMRVLPPFSQGCDDFVENYYPWHQRRVRKMPGQTWVIRADYTDSFKGHPRIVSCIGSGDRARYLLVLHTSRVS